MKKLAALIMALFILLTAAVFASEEPLSVNVSGDKLTVYINCPSGGNLNIYLLKPGADPGNLTDEALLSYLYDIRQIKDADSQSLCEFTFSEEDSSGTYIVFGVCEDFSLSCEAEYLNRSDLILEIYEKLNGSSGQYGLISEYYSYLELEENEAFKAFPASSQEVFDRVFTGLPKKTPENIKEIFTEAVDVTVINEAPYTALYELLKNNNNLKIDFSAYENSDKTAVMKELANYEFKSYDDIPPKFNTAVANHPKTVSSGGGGGGGGAGRVTEKVTVEEPEQKNQEPAFREMKFTDLDKAAWAKDSVEYLYRNGIIDGKSEEIFDPEGNITREEFLKLVLSALKIPAETEKSSAFADVPENMWYYEYVNTGYKNGIINGIGGGRFGIGEPIVRQDMAVICMKALSHKGIKLPKLAESVFFNDSSEIDEYAAESVAAMAESGIINGMPDGSFAPQSCLTRAEAAKAVCGIITTVSGV